MSSIEDKTNMDKNVIQTLIVEYQQFVSKVSLVEREIHLSDNIR